MTKLENKKAYTFQEAAKQIGVSVATLYRWMHDGKLKTIKIAGTRRITAQQLSDLLRSHEV